MRQHSLHSGSASPPQLCTGRLLRGLGSDSTEARTAVSQHTLHSGLTFPPWSRAVTVATILIQARPRIALQKDATLGSRRGGTSPHGREQGDQGEALDSWGAAEDHSAAKQHSLGGGRAPPPRHLPLQAREPSGARAPSFVYVLYIYSLHTQYTYILTPPYLLFPCRALPEAFLFGLAARSGGRVERWLHAGSAFIPKTAAIQAIGR